MTVHFSLMFLSERREFSSAPCLVEGDLMTARVSMLLKSRASHDKLRFSLCNKKRLAIRHMKRPLFPPTLSIPSYDIGKEVGLRTYQHPLVWVKQQDGYVRGQTTSGNEIFWINKCLKTYNGQSMAVILNVVPNFISSSDANRYRQKLGQCQLQHTKKFGSNLKKVEEQ